MLLNLFFTSLLWADPTETKAVGGHHVIFCTIFDAKGEVLRRYDGSLCLFHDDGRVFAAKTEGLSAWNKNMAAIWQRPYYVHHQMNWSLDKTQILALGSEFTQREGKLVRIDTLYVFDLNGMIKKRFSFDEKTINKLSPDKMSSLQELLVPWPSVKTETQYEYTHANSFYEIPTNSSAAKLAAFARGNYIVNDTMSHRIIIFNRSLKKILWSMDYIFWGGHITHDVQVLPNGNLLIYANVAQVENGKKASALHEFDPIKKKIVWSFMEKPPHKFFSECCGGVQLLDNGNILYSDISSGQAYGIEITRSGKEVWRMSPPDKDVKSGKKIHIHQIKRVDLSSFLKNNLGL